MLQVTREQEDACAVGEKREEILAIELTKRWKRVYSAVRSTGKRTVLFLKHSE
jgi:hypothetical protein